MRQNTNKKIALMLTFILLGLVVTVFYPLSENDYAKKEDYVGLTKEQVLFKIIISSLEDLHFDAKPLDDELSTRIFDLFIDQLDGGKRFFVKQDILGFRPYKTDIDNEIARGSFEFFQEVRRVFLKRMNYLEEFVDNELSKPIKFNPGEHYEIRTIDDTERVEDLTALKELWRKILYYNVLQELNKEEAQQKKNIEKGNKVKLLTEEEILMQSIAEIKDAQAQEFKYMKSLDEQDWLSFYLNSYTSAFDPHTTYLPPRDKETFDIQMSGQLQGIGARLDRNKGHIIVLNIVVGSPCWKQGDLEVGDKILMVTETNTGVTTNLVGMRVDQAVTYIRGKKGTEVKLTVEHPDGSREVIPITRDIIEIEETYVKKAIVNNVGYIFLPRFYADFNGTGGHSCAEDIKQTVLELEKENVKGIVLDVRSNGGGSLAEVVDMSGLFINNGPIVQVKSKVDKKIVMSDTDKKSIYDGPLVILVNDISASASEILTAALQDYNRAIIIGSAASTYGKGTVQRVIYLDEQLKGGVFDDMKPFGALKFTLQKFYRIDGSSTQLKGVIPDITLPSPRYYLETGEKKLNYAIPWDTITPAKYEKLDGLDKEKIKTLSEERTSSDVTFAKINEYAKWLKKSQDEVTRVPLNVSEYKEWKQERTHFIEDYKVLMDKIEGMPTKLTEKDQARYNTDTVYAAKTKKWFKSLEKDVYVKEAINVINDIK